MNAVSMQSNATTARNVRRVVVAVVLAMGAAAAVSAWAQPGGGHHGGGHGMGGPGMMMMFSGSPERVARVVDHLLDGLSATDAQRVQVKQIAQAAATDLKAQRDAAGGQRDRALQVLMAPNVDAAAAESVRQQMLVQHDQRSRRVLQAMLDVARVLTPEQRTRLGERFKQREAQHRERSQRMERERAPR
jgi:periplasmic protein CpxP/Spy